MRQSWHKWRAQLQPHRHRPRLARQLTQLLDGNNARAHPASRDIAQARPDKFPWPDETETVIVVVPLPVSALVVLWRLVELNLGEIDPIAAKARIVFEHGPWHWVI